MAFISFNGDSLGLISYEVSKLLLALALRLQRVRRCEANAITWQIVVQRMKCFIDMKCPSLAHLAR